MNVDLVHTVLFLSCLVLGGTSAVLYFYIKKKIMPVIVASEESAELFTRLETFANHLNSVYELPTFYGDDTLKSLLDHTRETCDYLQRYENVYSFTQPDLIEILKEVDRENDEEEAQEK
tara:strand:- start:8476 stop:8832 length:357 start_codon:yes stop_codon:yes gene_type:complete